MDREKLYGGLSTSLLKFVRHLILGNATLKPHIYIYRTEKAEHRIKKISFSLESCQKLVSPGPS